ncbi:MAG: CUAEP/CCAEP-tail radical SAM (seleno)protein [Nitriliruptorales bacterium]
MDVRILLISTYELGHQPLHLASPAAALRSAGHDVRCLDTSVQGWDEQAVTWAEAVGFSVPMHTAMRLGLRAAAGMKQVRPHLPVVFYGLYAPVSRDLTVGRLTDRVLAGQYEQPLVAWFEALANGAPPGAPTAQHTTRPAHRPPASPPTIYVDRGTHQLPARDLLPPLGRYARLAIDGELRLVGYVEATQGCLHECRHCPVPTVYGGRFRATARDLILADIDQLVGMGARHISFGDPDFLNGPTHSLRLVRELHERWPWLTFDCTTKVDHILDHAELWETFAACGCLFVVSAFETTNDEILARLDKGHTSRQAAQAVRLLRSHGIEVRPSWLPFTPWTTTEDVADLLGFVAEHDLVGNVDPVQYTIRLLLPQGSLLVDHPDLQPHLGPYDSEGLTFTWTAADPAVDRLQRDLAELLAERVAQGASIESTFNEVSDRVVAASGLNTPLRSSGFLRSPLHSPGHAAERPRLTEPWFC